MGVFSVSTFELCQYCTFGTDKALVVVAFSGILVK